MKNSYVMIGICGVLMISLVGNLVQGRILKDKCDEIYEIKRINYKMIDEDLEGSLKCLADAFDGAHDVKEVLKEVSFNIEKLRNDIDMFNRTSKVVIEEEAIGESAEGLLPREKRFLKKLYGDLLQVDEAIHNMGEQCEEEELAEIFNEYLVSCEYENLIQSPVYNETCD